MQQVYPYLQHTVLVWDVHVLLDSAEEVFSISVVSTDHAHAHCRFQGSYKKNKVQLSDFTLDTMNLAWIRNGIYLTSVLKEELRDVFCSMY